ncbi:metallophosphoesterase family protein [Paragemmobacter straminiformis]|uniref:Metallophosphoesterase n=1 Tax=Paragemmobacter straminiformis TaxID=2045119 RepID=A0A842IDA2_9RHOB|nr:metallophosphoesterase [Gemmobacter straminiformis]MBC2836908.1 metallophosphoesterase [Gemmobacter straminiformis]
MSVIVHLSDPHFGAERPDLVEPLLAAVARLAPDLVVLSGDLTQRARSGQYAAAMRLLAGCRAPVLVVPGNHDVPLWNIGLRLVDPWRRWRRAVGPELGPLFVNDAMLVLGLNTADPMAWKNGRIGAVQLQRVAEVCATAGARRRVLVLHHPLQGPPSEPPALRGAAAAIPALVDAGVDMVLSGHLHSTYATPLAAAPGILSVQAGTCLSHRVRGDGNAFNSLRLVPGGVVLTHYRAQADRTFRADADLVLMRGAAGWEEGRGAAASPDGV